MKEFRGKVAVVTGAASGIGRAIATRLAREGMKVVLSDVEGPALEAAVEALASDGTEVLGVACDVSRYEAVEALERRALERFGRVHVLCNNAGVGAQEDVPTWELPLEDWGWTFSVNVWGVIHGVKAFLPGMLAHGEPGHVVNTSSGNGGLVLVPGTPIYSASKAAVSAMTETLHHQLVQRNAAIRASVLYPGPHIVTSNIFDARRNRPDAYARTVPQAAVPITLEMIKDLAKQAGTELPTTSPEEVAEHCFEGLANDAFYILPLSVDLARRIRERTDGVLERRNPVPPPY